MGETAKKTLLAVLLAWLVARVLRRVIGVAMLAALAAGGLALGERHGVDAGGVGRVVRCETRAIVRAAQQLRDGASSSSPTVIERRQRALRRLGGCHVQPTPAAPQGGAPRP